MSRSTILSFPLQFVFPGQSLTRSSEQFVDGFVVVESDDDPVPDEVVPAAFAELARLGHHQQVDEERVKHFVVLLIKTFRNILTKEILLGIAEQSPIEIIIMTPISLNLERIESFENRDIAKAKKPSIVKIKTKTFNPLIIKSKDRWNARKPSN
jgi:hypothetical protein